jgi:hypothetical protein
MFNPASDLPPKPDRQSLTRILSKILAEDPSNVVLDRENWMQSAAKKWGDEANGWEVPACYLTVVESWLLSKIREDIEFTRVDTRRAATLWSSLAARDVWQDPDPRRRFFRWFPVKRPDLSAAAGLTEDDAVTLIRAIEAQAGPSYSLPFPVYNEQTGREFLITCELTRLKCGLELLPKDQRFVLAPWSYYLLHASNVEKFNDSIDMWEQIDPTARFIIDLVAPGELAWASDTVLVEGNSLDLALLLAALSVAEKPSYFLPFFPTGKIMKAEGRLTVIPVRDIEEKWNAVKDYARHQRERVRFLVPAGTKDRIGYESYMEDDQWVETVEAKEDVAALLEQVRRGFSDGCDALRLLLNEHGEIREEPPTEAQPYAFEADDIAELNGFAREAKSAPRLRDVKNSTLKTVVLSFNNDPVRAARHLAWNVADQNLIPLILPLYRHENTAVRFFRDPIDELAQRVAQAGGSIDKNGDQDRSSTADEIDLIPQQAARNLLADQQPRVLLIIHDRRSLEVDYGQAHSDDVKRIWSTLRRVAGNMRAVLIASDFHHFKQLVELGLAAESAKPMTSATGSSIA